jgi:hypothetical protein
LPTRIELLTSLQRLDQGIKEKKEATEAVTRKLRELEVAVEQRSTEAAQLGTQLGEVKTRQLALERELAEIEEKMKDRRMRLQRIRSERELQATQREIELMKERTAELEEQELVVLEESEALAAKVSAAEENAKGGREALAREREDLVAQTATLTEDIGRATAARDELIGSLDGTLLRRYELIFSKRRGTAVVSVHNGICQGCHMNVPPQLYNQILRGEDVHACPSCHRLLFSAPESVDGDQR